MSTLISGSLNGDLVDAVQALAAKAVTNTTQVFIAHDQKASGTNGGALVANTNVTRDLNTIIVNTITGASLDTSTSRITLPAGTYLISASAVGQSVGRHVLLLRNITDSSNEVIGAGSILDSSLTRAFIESHITISAEKVFELQHRVSISNSAGQGISSLAGTVEVYAMIKIEK
jgi:hypothetical protein